MNHAAEVKAAILELIAKMDIAGANGIKFEFHIATDAKTLQSKLERFAAFQTIKDN